MRFELDYLQEHGVTRLQVYGVLNHEAYQPMIMAALADMQVHGTAQLIVDLRHASLGMSMQETVSLPEINQALGVSLEQKVAIVITEANPKVNGVRLYEILAAHRGYDHKLFTRYPAALLWFIDRELYQVT
ncbi:hypothetical protein LG202_24440 [Methylobacillus methanolivorans]